MQKFIKPIPAYVYLLSHSSDEVPLFKLGKSMDVLQTMKALGSKNFNPGKSICIRMRTSADANHLLAVIEQMIEKFNVEISADQLTGGSKAGMTQWYSNECRAKLESTLKDRQDFYTYEIIPVSELTPGVAVAPRVTVGDQARLAMQVFIDRETSKPGFKRVEAFASKDNLRTWLKPSPFN